jgi:hypothetical protein
MTPIDNSSPATPPPATRLLRAFAYDPSLATQLENFDVSEVQVRVRWEPDRHWQDEKGTIHAEAGVLPGPVGDYIEVVDVDPASGCVYPPVNLNDPHLLAQDGLVPSEGNPQFHQQMVYAVAMTTIQHFERALGRKVFWSELRRNGNFTPIQRMRIYPHALRDENAFYDPEKKALLFGYFPARPQLLGDEMTGGIIFSCLSHDIVAHETTHAILDGMQRYFLDPSNVDVLAFHEAFADMVALFQHFTYPEILRRQIGGARGNLDTETLLGQLAVQFGKATGQRRALRDAIGHTNKATGEWELAMPDPTAYLKETEPHARGALLVATVFDAFRAIYRHRTRDLLRIATGGTGILPSGDLHPDLVNRLADEAAKTAEHLLLMCIRAIDYCPPVDITFGDYLRALITADSDLVPEDTRNYRVAMVEAFRRRGIYPADVRTLSEKSLHWHFAEDQGSSAEFSRILRPAFFQDHFQRLWDEITKSRDSTGPATEERRKLSRMEVYKRTKEFQGGFHEVIQRMAGDLVNQKRLAPGEHPFGFNLSCGHVNDQKFEVHQVRPVHRLSPDGRTQEDLLIQITQKRPGFLDENRQQKENERYTTIGQTIAPPTNPDFWYRGGATFILDLDSFEVRYGIQKDIVKTSRMDQQRQFISSTRGTSLRSLYFGEPASGQRLALLHMSED